LTLLFVRHGETALNAARVMQPADTPLSPRGLAQAQAVARRLVDFKPVALLSSDLPRALQTAQAVAAATGLPLQTTPLLHERNFGAFRGRPHGSFDFDPVTMDEAPPEGESMAEFLDRVAQAFAQAVGLRKGLQGPLVVVSHGLVIRALLGPQVALAPGTALPHRIGNTSITEVEAAPPHRALRIDCQQHLQGATAEDGQSLSGG
jgi:probable phosphoglycerate mutase